MQLTESDILANSWHFTVDFDMTNGVGFNANPQELSTPAELVAAFRLAAQPGSTSGFTISLLAEPTGPASTTSIPAATCNETLAGTQKWQFKTGNLLDAALAIGPDGTLYQGSYDKKLYAIDPTTGATLWTFETGDWISGGATIADDGTVYIGSGDYSLYALNPADGSMIWSFASESYIKSSPALASDGTIYVTSEDGRLYALSPADGSALWSFKNTVEVYPAGAEIGDYIVSSPAIDASGTIIYGSGDGMVYALNPAGTLKWQYDTGAPILASPALGSDGTVYIGSNSGVFAALDSGGSLLWQFSTADIIRTSAAIGADGTVYCGAEDGNLYAFNPADGSLKWTFATPGLSDSVPPSIMSSPAIGADGTIFVGARDNRLYAVNPADGTELWQFEVDHRVSTPVTIGPDSTVYAGTAVGTLFAIYSCTGGPAETAWPMFQYNLENTGRPDAGTTPGSSTTTIAASTCDLSVAGTLKWSFETGDIVNASPALSDSGILYVSSHDNSLYALDADTGSLQWQYTTEGALFSAPVIAGNETIYVSSFDGNMYAIKPDGNLLWKTDLAYSENSVLTWLGTCPALGSDGTIYAGLPGGKLTALDPADGSAKWTIQLSETIYASPVVGSDGTIYIPSHGSSPETGNFGYFYAVNPDGTEKWKTQFDYIFSSPAIGSDGTIYFSTGYGYVQALDAATGAILWTAPDKASDAIYSSPAIGIGGLIWTPLDQLTGLNTEDGSTQVTAPLFPNYSSAAIGDDGTVYIGGKNIDQVYGYSLVAYSPEDDTVAWEYTTGNIVHCSPTVGSDGTIYFGSWDNSVYAVNSCSTGLADTAWPMFHHDPSHSGNAAQ